MDTPLSAYWKLAREERQSFLLESVTGGEQLARYSMIGVRPRREYRAQGPELVVSGGQRPERIPLGEGDDPLKIALSRTPKVEHDPGDPPLCGGLVGMIGYDYVRRIEKLPKQAEDDLELDDLAMLEFGTTVVFDHAHNTLHILVLAEGTEQAYLEAKSEVERILHRLRQPLPDLPITRGFAPEFECNRTETDYKEAVEACREYIRAGDAFQIVPSLRLSAPVKAHPMSIYRALRSLNPSPYMYLLRFGDFDVVGASPEILVGLSDGEAHVRPIAGTRPRSDDPAEDKRRAEELLADEKERAEHVMLIDLGRNDIGRISEYGSVSVDDLMVIERYSHVMHIVSSVSGKVREGLGAADVVRACFPAGTLSGAPKVRAMEIIEEQEPTRRGLYGGAVGYFSASGDVDLAIAIRSALIKDGKAHIQAGAGVVFDSDPQKEYEECLHKAGAVKRAIEMAETGFGS